MRSSGARILLKSLKSISVSGGGCRLLAKPQTRAHSILLSQQMSSSKSLRAALETLQSTKGISNRIINAVEAQMAKSKNSTGNFDFKS
jgi:hypothetical protein